VIDDLRARVQEPTARGVAHAISAAIADGTLEPGQKLPPIRALATQLDLSPTTVSAAWALLTRSGAIRTDGRRGTVVALRTPPGPSRYRRVLTGRSSSAGPGNGLRIDLSAGVPDPALLPDLGAALGRVQRLPAPQTYLDEPVVPELGDLLRAHWPFPAEKITITDGAMDALDLLSDQLLRFGDLVGVENPCFPQLLDLLDARGVRTVAIDVDDNGLVVEQLRTALDRGVRIVFTQPRAQNPTGASLSADRARALAAVLRGRGVLVVENDSAGAVASAALISLGRWLPENTVHIRGFSKSHGPDLRLAAVGGPASLIDGLEDRRHLGQGWTSRLLQRVLLDLLTDHMSISQVARARAEYSRRRRLMVAELARLGVEVGGSDGINIWLPVIDEAAALVGLASHGISAAPGGPFAVDPNPAPHLRVTVGLLAHDHTEVARALAAAGGAVRWNAPR
jgi:DNA-binding transcriptional MocR family regulator